jgi:hypothetical protein
MTTTTITFDGGSVGSNIAAGSNGIDSVPDALLPKFSTGFHGAAQVTSGTSSNTADSRFRVDLGLSGDHFGSIYLKMNTNHTSSGNFVTFLSWANSGNTILASLRCGSSREFNIRSGTSTVVRAGSSNEIPAAGSEWRCDWQYTGTTVNWRIFYNPEALVGDTPDLSGSFSAAAGTVAKLVLGVQSSQTIVKHWSHDTVRARNTGSWWDPFNPPPVGPTYKVWNGSAEVAATAKVWNGSAEVAIGSWDVST